jgi:outer membrane lipoprotein-sorting protein
MKIKSSLTEHIAINRGKKNFIVFICIFIAIAFVGVTLVYSQQSYNAFSADLIQHLAALNKDARGKIYVTKDKIRIDTDMGGGISGSGIVRMDKNVYWTLVPAQRAYIEMPIPANLYYTKSFTESAPSGTLMGSEMVNGKLADKYEGAGGQITWIDKATGFPVKSVSSDGNIVEFRNIQIGEPPTEVFEIPQDYRQLSMQIPSL